LTADFLQHKPVAVHTVTQLDNAVRVATAPMPAMRGVTVGIWVGVGGRFESKKVCGVSHFIEHMLFKGTKKRNAREISQAIEGIGGYLNAFTSEETTCYFATSEARHAATLLDVLSDMYRNSVFAAAEIEKERKVIREELFMYRDQPQQYVHELLHETLWPDQPLGRSLTGTPESLEAIRRADILRYKTEHYRAANTVVAVAGACEHEKIVGLVSQFLPLNGEKASRFPRVEERQRAPRYKIFEKNTEQSHVAIGIRGCSRHDPRRYALKLLSVILGENMSSRLFQVVRERHGLAYSIQSATSFFADTGAFEISAGLDNKKVGKALRLIARELQKIAQQPPSVAELQRAKDYTIGQMWLGLETTMNRMLWLGEHLLGYGEIISPDEIQRKIEAVNPDEIQSLAAELFRDSRLNVAVIGPMKNDRDVRESLALA
jgi:predicted Zn-dependent peptidase